MTNDAECVIRKIRLSPRVSYNGSNPPNTLANFAFSPAGCSSVMPVSTFDPYLEWFGISPNERPVDHYRLLGLAPLESDPEVIRDAADRRMAHVRTFQAGRRAEASQRMLNELASAKTCLLDPKTKATYDAVLEGGLSAARRGASFEDYRAAPPPVVVPPPLPSLSPSPPPSMPLPQPTLGAPAISPPRPQVTEESGDPAAAPSFFLGPWFPILVVAGVSLVVLTTFGFVLAMQDRDGSRAALQDDATDQGVDVPQATPVDDQPLGVPRVEQQADGVLHFTAANVELEGSPRLTARSGATLVSDITSPDDRLKWRFHVDKPAAFRIEATYAVAPGAAGGQFVLATDEHQTKPIATRDTGGADSFTSERVGFLWVKKSGNHELTLRPMQLPVTGSLMELESLRFVPVRGTAAD